jgi:hypothetical protein
MEGDEVRKGISGIIIVLIGLLAWSGCGGGGSSLSKAEYQQQLELVCNKGLQEREEFLVKSNELAAEGKVKVSKADGIRKLFGVYAGTTEKIAEIGLPEEEEEKAEELVQAREASVAKVEADPFSALTDSVTIFAKPRKIAEELEVASCAK